MNLKETNNIFTNRILIHKPKQSNYRQWLRRMFKILAASLNINSENN